MLEVLDATGNFLARISLCSELISYVSFTFLSSVFLTFMPEQSYILDS